MPGRGALISAALFLSCTATLELALSSSLPSSGDSGRAGRALLESHEIAQCDTISFAGCPDHLQDPDLQLAAMRELPSDSGIGSGSGGSAPSEWTCSASFYNANDGCDCNCGAQDPDCGKPGNDKVFNCSPEEQYCVGGICVSATPAPTPLSCSEDIMSICSAPSCAAAYQAYVTCQRNIQNDINCGKPDPFIFYECSRCGVAVDGLEEPEDVPLSTLLALRAFKAAITGDPYGALDTWNEDTPVCQWWGISCNECGDDVTGLCAHPTPPFVWRGPEERATLFHHACGRLRRPPCRGQDANVVSMRHSESAGPPHTTNGGALPRALASVRTYGLQGGV